MIDRIGRQWLEVFQGNTDFYSAIYWDLLTQIWRSERPVRKTDALKSMTGVKSAHTAGKYIQVAIDQGLIEEADNPNDARSRVLVLAPKMRERLEFFFDGAVDELKRANDRVEERR
jgi:DNA-binding MarR family transcriptional regulator